MKYILIALATFLSSPAIAAMTSDYNCVTADGARVYWEAQELIHDQNGLVLGSTLYRNHVTVSINDVSVEFKPARSLTANNSALLAAFSKDGKQYVIVSAEDRQENPKESDVAEFKGVMEFRVKTKDGYIQRGENTPVSCTMAGEG